MKTICVASFIAIMATVGVIQTRSGHTMLENWQRQHQRDSGWRLVSVSVVDSMHAFACGWHDSAYGLVVRTTDGGTNWTELKRNFPFYVNDIHFVSDSIGWIAGGDNSVFSGFILKTTDGGITWATQHGATRVRFWSVFFLDAMRGWVCGDSGKILATTNGGVLWQEQLGGRNMGVNDIFLFPSGLGWAGGGFGPATAFFRTTDFGARWDSISNIRLSKLSFLNDSLGWAVAANSWLNWKTIDGGHTWTQGWYYGPIYQTDVVMLSDTVVLSPSWDNRVDPPNQYYPISLRDLTDPPPPPPGLIPPPIETRTRILFGIDFVASGHGFAVGLDNIVSSNDYGQIWRNQVGVITGNLTAIDMADGANGWAVGEKNLILRTTDGGIHWKPQTEASQSKVCTVCSIDGQHAFAGGTEFWSTTNGGKTWLRTQPFGIYEIRGLSFISPLIGWATTTGSNRIFRTNDGGKTWHQQSVNPNAELTAIEFVDSLYGWCTGTTLIYRTTDGGLRWNQQIPSGYIRGMDFVDRNYGWIVKDQIVLKTVDGGLSWDTSYVANLDTLVNGLHFFDRQIGWAVSRYGMIIGTTNGGASWRVQRRPSVPGANHLLAVDAVSSLLVWASGEGGEILHTANGGGITSVRTVASEAPMRFDLKQNYPNPFNPTTTLSYALPEETFVSLRIFDILGREIATLVNQYQKAGQYDVQFDASSLPSGVYLYKIQAGAFTDVKRMLFLK